MKQGTKYEAKNMQTPRTTQVIIYIFCVAHFFLISLSMNFTRVVLREYLYILVPSLGKIVLNLDRSMKDLFFMLLFCVQTFDNPVH